MPCPVLAFVSSMRSLHHRAVLMALSAIILGCAWLIAPSAGQSSAVHPYYLADSATFNLNQSTSAMATGSNLFAYYNANIYLFLTPMKPQVIGRYSIALGREISPINFTATGLAGSTFGFDVTAMKPQQVVTSYNRIVLITQYQSTSTVAVTMNFTGYWLAATTITGLRGLDIDRSGTNVVAVSTGSMLTVYAGDSWTPVSSLAAAANQQFFGVSMKPDGTVIVAANSSGIPTMNNYDTGLNLIGSYSASRVRALTTANFLVDMSMTMVWLGPVSKGEWHYLNLRDQSFVVQTAYNGSFIEPNQFGQIMIISYNQSTNTRSILTFNRTQTTSLPSSSSTGTSGGVTPGNSGSSSSSDHNAMIGLAVALGVLGVIAIVLIAMIIINRTRGGDKLSRGSTTTGGTREGSLNSPMV